MTLSEALQFLQTWVSVFAWKALAALLILVMGLVFATIVRRIMYWALSRRPEIRIGTAFFVPSIIQLGIVVLTLASTLAVLGVTGSVVGVIVTIGLAVGLIADLINGLRMLGFAPYMVGDEIEIQDKGVAGLVEEITLSTTILRTSDDTKVHIPNRKLFDWIVIHSGPKGKILRFQLTTKPEADIEAIQNEIRLILSTTPGVKTSVPAEIHLKHLEQNAITFTVQFRASHLDAAQVSSDFLKAAKRRFDNAGIFVCSLSAVE